MKRTVILVTSVVIVLLPLLYLAGCSAEKGGKQGVKYHCPMHPTYVSDRPGDCPICNMKLVPIEPERKEPAPAPKGHEGHDAAPPTEGMAPVSISAEGIRIAGVQTAAASLESLQRTIRTVGEVVPDETLIHHMHTKVPGWIEKLYVNFTGQPVTKGQPILSIYSQELLATQEEYLTAREAAGRFASSTIPEVRKGGEDLLKAARRRLQLFDVPEAFIANLERTGKVKRTVTLNAPTSGFVTAKGIYEGQQVEPGMELYTCTDLSRVWIEGAFYEYEARELAVGQPARVTLAYDPGVSFDARIDYIYPYLDAESRTLRVRLVAQNPELKLKPAMYANVELLLDAGEGIVIPDSALIDTGERQMVFVQEHEGHYLPRDVKVGQRAGGKAQVLQGLSAGELVVTRANFLIDSESRLRAAIGAAAGGGHQHGGTGQ